MGMSEAVILDMMGHMVVLGTALGTLMVPGYWSLQMGNVKVITSEECVPKHKLLVMDIWFKATKRWHGKFEP